MLYRLCDLSIACSCAVKELSLTKHELMMMTMTKIQRLVSCLLITGILLSVQVQSNNNVTG